MGYGRINWEPAVRMMNHVYHNHWRLIQNFYYPQQKLISKQRFGSKIVRKMSEPKTPFQRLAPFLSTSEYLNLLEEKKAINPKESMRKLRAATRNIMKYFKNDINESEWGKLLI